MLKRVAKAYHHHYGETQLPLPTQESDSSNFDTDSDNDLNDAFLPTVTEDDPTPVFNDPESSDESVSECIPGTWKEVTSDDDIPESEIKTIYRCELCLGKVFNSVVAAESHVRGKLHQKKLRSLIKRENKESSTSVGSDTDAKGDTAVHSPQSKSKLLSESTTPIPNTNKKSKKRKQKARLGGASSRTKHQTAPSSSSLETGSRTESSAATKRKTTDTSPTVGPKKNRRKPKGKGKVRKP
ncbi:hypothetical protein IWQ61_000045 [Dispira simplex]|nr:hypothetical protein IWQ61_000045 [Dispira simplex]